MDGTDGNRKKVPASHWTQLAEKKLERIGRSVVAMVQELLKEELGIDILARVDLPTFFCTDNDMVEIILSKWSGQEQKRWPEFMQHGFLKDNIQYAEIRPCSMANNTEH